MYSKKSFQVLMDGLSRTSYNNPEQYGGSREAYGYSREYINTTMASSMEHINRKQTTGAKLLVTQRKYFDNATVRDATQSTCYKCGKRRWGQE